MVSRAAEILRADVDRFARLVTLEMGKRISESRGEVQLTAEILDYYAQHAEEFLAPQVLNPASGEATFHNEPRSVCSSGWSRGTSRTTSWRGLPRPT